MIPCRDLGLGSPEQSDESKTIKQLLLKILKRLDELESTVRVWS